MLYVSQQFFPNTEPHFTDEEIRRVASFYELLITVDRRLKITNEQKQEIYGEH